MSSIYPTTNLVLDKIKDRQIYLWRWAQELKQTIEASSPEDRWELFGHGLVLEGEDADGCEQSIRLISEQLNIGFQYLNSTQILDIEDLVGKNFSHPKIVFIEAGDWIQSSSNDDESLQKQKTTTEFLKNLVGKPIVCILVSDSYADIATCFRYQRIFDRHLQWMEPMPEFIGQDLIDLVGAEKFDISILNSMNRLGCILCSDFPVSRRIGMLASALRRIAHFQNRQIQWQDIYRLVTSGTGDGYESTRNKHDLQVAIHEAGHALITVLESDGKNIPEIASILSGKGYVGIVVEGYQHAYETEGPLSFKAACTKIRIALAGRVAEELTSGRLEVDVHLAQDDLRRASRIAFDLVTKGGFDCLHGEKELSGSNLFIPEREASKTNDHYLNQARTLMEKQYEAVRFLLIKHRDSLELIVSELLNKKLLTHQDFREMGFSRKESTYSKKIAQSGSLTH